MWPLPQDAHRDSLACSQRGKIMKTMRVPRDRLGVGDLRRKLPDTWLTELGFAFLLNSPTRDIFPLESAMTEEEARGISMVFWWNTLGHLFSRVLYVFRVLKALVDSGAFVRAVNYVYSSCPQEVRTGQGVFLSAPWVSFDLRVFGCQCPAIRRQAVWTRPVHTTGSSHLPPNMGTSTEIPQLFLFTHSSSQILHSSIHNCTFPLSSVELLT